MLTQNADKKREQLQMFCIDDMVPQDHLLRIIDKAIDWNFIYDLVEDKYCSDNDVQAWIQLCSSRFLSFSISMVLKACVRL